MSQPNQPLQVPPGSAGIAFSMGQGPDGKIHGVMHILTPPANYQVAFPPDVVEELNQGLPAQITEWAAAVRRANMGLAIAPATLDITKLPKNGHRQ